MHASQASGEMSSVIENKPQSRAQLKDRLRRVRDALTEGLIERDIPIRLAFLAAIAGEHTLLVGPPGTAKSELARRLRRAFTGQTYFERLLTRFSVPEELFGPLSIKALEEDKYLRQTKGYLPEASIAFLDEIFKANSAILNSLLTLLNEREFDNGTERVKTPLVSVVGASNELPQEEELLALYDRFLVRLHVGPVSDDSFGRLLNLRGNAKSEVADADRLTPQDIEEIHAAALDVTMPGEVESLLKAIRKFCQDQEIPVSDRRWRKAKFLLQVAAYTDGRDKVSVWDCWLLQHCLWDEPEELATLATWYLERAGAASPREPERFSKVAAAWEQRLQGDSGRVVQKSDESGRPLYRGPDGTEVLFKTTTRKKQSYGYNSEEETVQNAPIMIESSYAAGHIAERVSGVAAAINEVRQFVSWSNEEAKRLEQEIRNHVWLDPAFAAPASRNLHDHIQRANTVLARFEDVKKGFEKLPRERREAGLDDDQLTVHVPLAVGDRVTFTVDRRRCYGEIRDINGLACTVVDEDGTRRSLLEINLMKA